MEFTKEQTIERPLLKRTDAVFRMAYEGATPKRHAIVQSLSTKEKGTVIVRTIKTIQGEQIALVHASIYKDASVATAVERAKLIEKQQPKAEAPAAETA